MVDQGPSHEIDPDEIDPDEIDPDEIDPDEIDPDEIDPDEIDPDEIDHKPAPCHFCSSNLRFHCGAISLRSMFREGGKKAGVAISCGFCQVPSPKHQIPANR
jgi:hypothetical protein